MPFKALVEQVQRLFSSKKNGAKLVYSITDRFHYFKVVLLFVCILLLVGYSQFRQHFKCDGMEIKDGASLTELCWFNGTSTVDSRTNRYRAPHRTPHVGLGILPGKTSQLNNNHNNNSQRQKARLIVHNYMPYYWPLLILMIFCSYVPQRFWSNIFNNDLMKALLQLPGYEQSPLVKSAQEARPYEKLVSLRGDKRAEEPFTMGPTSRKSPSLVQIERMFQYLNSITDHENVHNHLLDYYPNQLVYLLIAKDNCAYKLLSMRLRRKLFRYSLYSTCFSCLQFLMPRLLFGPEYTLYGWKFARLSLNYCILQLLAPRSDINSITYRSSALIWPTVVNCEFQQYGYQGKFESFGVQCTVAINDLCGKMFAVVWWLVVVSIVVELYSLFWATCYLLKPEFFLGHRFWPQRRREAAMVASFRFRRSKKMAGQLDANSGACAQDLDAKFLTADEEKKRLSQQASAASGGGGGASTNGCKKKGGGSGAQPPLAALLCWSRVYEYLVERSGRRRRTREIERLLSELHKDANLYHLFQLLYMRLGHDSRKVEQIIAMCSEALENYLEFWSRFAEVRATLKETLPVERAGGPAGSAPAESQLAPPGPNKRQQQPTNSQPVAHNKELLQASSILTSMLASQQQHQDKSRPDTVIDVNIGHHI